MITVTFSLLKATEGGTAARFVLDRLKDAGIIGKRVHSPYVGHYGIAVPARQQRKAERILYPQFFAPTVRRKR